MLLEVGRIAKPHGLRGEVVVEFVTNVESRRQVGAAFETDRGPLVITAIRPHQERYLVTFDGIADRTAAEDVRGLVLRATPQPQLEPDVLWVHELIGKRCVEASGVDRGEIVGVLGNPGGDLLELDTQLLVNLRWITTQTEETVVVEVPEGFFEAQQD